MRERKSKSGKTFSYWSKDDWTQKYSNDGVNRANGGDVPENPYHVPVPGYDVPVANQKPTLDVKQSVYDQTQQLEYMDIPVVDTGVKRPGVPMSSYNVNTMLQMPQAVLTTIASGGKHIYPSKALGIDNPTMAFLTDAALDPTNFVGGAAAKPAVSRALRERIYHAVSPRSYGDEGNRLKNIIMGRQRLDPKWEGNFYQGAGREEAWKKYLGLIEDSELEHLVPTGVTSDGMQTYKFKKFGSTTKGNREFSRNTFNDAVMDILVNERGLNLERHHKKYITNATLKDRMTNTSFTPGKLWNRNNWKAADGTTRYQDIDVYNDVMGGFNWRKEGDVLHYEDVWDLHPFQSKKFEVDGTVKKKYPWYADVEASKFIPSSKVKPFKLEGRLEVPFTINKMNKLLDDALLNAERDIERVHLPDAAQFGQAKFNPNAFVKQSTISKFLNKQISIPNKKSN